MKKWLSLVMIILFSFCFSIIVNGEVIDKTKELSEQEINDITMELNKYHKDMDIPVTFYLLDTESEERDIHDVLSGLYFNTYSNENGLIIVYFSGNKSLYIESGKNVKGMFSSIVCDKMVNSGRIYFSKADYLSGITSMLEISQVKTPFVVSALCLLLGILFMYLFIGVVSSSIKDICLYNENGFR